MNGRAKGRTPASIRVGDKLGLGSLYVFRAELEGYKPQVQAFKEPGLGDANDAVPAQVHFVLTPAEFATEPKVFGESASSPWGSLRILGYEFDNGTKMGTLVMDLGGRTLEVREWVVNNIGKICTSKSILKAGQETSSGGNYRVLKESMVGGILTIQFSAGAGE